MSTALRSVGLLDVLSSRLPACGLAEFAGLAGKMPALPSRLAMKPGEKRGLRILPEFDLGLDGEFEKMDR
jgi:hypothetical protein